MPPPLASLLDRWRHRPTVPGRLVVPPGLRAWLAAALAARGPVLAVVPGERDAEELADDAALFVAACHLPAWETLPFEHVSPSVQSMGARALARHLLARGEPGLVVASVRAVTQRVSPSAVAPVVVRSGEEARLEQVSAALVAAGYHRTDRVEARGEMAVRGGLVDVYPAQGRHPVRVDFWGDRVEEVRAFAVGDQRSTDALEALVAYPAREVRPDAGVRAAAARLGRDEPWAATTWDRFAEGLPFPGMESWLPWLAPERTAADEAAPGTTVILFDPARSTGRSLELRREEAELAAALAPTWGPGAPQAGDHPALYLPLALPEAQLLAAPPVAAGPGEAALAVSGLDAVPGDPGSVAAALGRLLGRGV
ncbi:MAG: transcription-repair coupling factor Mfd, partial [Acidobacteria bacterium]|nr:transcription-repair coupling factor Mfd [Acidobacteriota bacterium]